MEGLKDKVAIVTGGATLIGASVVRAFHRAGTKVVIADINEKDGQAIAEELQPDVLFIKTDLANDAQIAACVNRNRKIFRRHRFPGESCMRLYRQRAGLHAPGMARQLQRQCSRRRADAASGPPAHGEKRRRRRGEFRQHQRKSGADGALALSRQPNPPSCNSPATKPWISPPTKFA